MNLRHLSKSVSHYSLTLPAEILLMMYLDKNMNAIIIGIIEIAIARYFAPLLAAISVEALKEEIITGNVNLVLVFNNTKGTR